MHAHPSSKLQERTGGYRKEHSPSCHSRTPHGAAPQSLSYTVLRTALTRLYSSSLAARMSREAPLPNASSMAASLLTREARMGVSEVPYSDSSPCVKAAADVCREGPENGKEG